MKEGGAGTGYGRSEAVFFQTHLLHPEVLDRFERLRVQLPERCDLYFLLDVAGLTQDELGVARRAAEEALLTFTFDEVARASAEYPNPWAEGSPTGLVPGNNDLLWLYLRNRIGAYERYWFIEHDVAFTGDWCTVFEYFRDRGADLLGTTLQPRSVLPEFYWWESFRAPDVSAGSSLLRGFFPIVRVTADALDALAEVYRAGWSGHFEVVVPTALDRLGLEIEDMGGRGPHVPDGGRRFYTNTPTRTSLAPGTFVYKPSRRFPGLRRNMLWHPVKSTGGRLSPYLEMGWAWLEKVRNRVGP